ncbi:SDR family NAD(P)-dependent oxidoreductase [Limibacterium fermenti]|mgnify:FL=1|uniref:SDR family NAD(P)-dependent oxidoreductase n=1 Tax=Limibacterium fermenti TaxID=3229863 RepID=UPI000E915A1D|nr:short-chain dehydrogenase [Porphyromonadaceae bacterium]
MKYTALITGASKGIGFELAKLFAKEGCSLILVARNADQLQQIKSSFEKDYKISVQVIVKDLSLPDAAEAIFREAEAPHITYLVNNAGFGDFGPFADTEWERYERMIQLNITTLTRLCHLFIQRESSQNNRQITRRILNVCSTAAFQPGPMMAVYFATKAYVLHFSEAIGYEVKNRGITVTSLCPGPTGTFFMEDSNMKKSSMVKGRKLPMAADVAKVGYQAMLKGKSVAIHGTRNKLIAFGVRLLPRKWVTRLSGKFLK